MNNIETPDISTPLTVAQYEELLAAWKRAAHNWEMLAWFGLVVAAFADLILIIRLT